ncbi:pyridoxamine 5'-phosphate oxidase family protein [Chloroflexota bacterium]
MAKLSEEAKKIISEIHPALVATASKNGRPNISPKGSFRVVDDEHVSFNEGGRLYTLANLRENPQLSAIVYNAATRQGCRIWGKAEILESGDLFNIISAEAASRGMTVEHLVKVAVEEVITF